MSLSMHTALTTIEEALRDTIADGLGKCRTAATLTDLRAYPTAAIKHGARAYCTAAAYRYAFDRFETHADNGTTYIRPADFQSNGVWVRTASTSGSGYLRGVELYDGDFSPSALLVRLNGVKPGVVIVYDGDEWTRPSTIAGSVYKNNYDFSVWCVSSNLRYEPRAATPSPIATESAADPGVNKITGDVAALLAGNQIGLGPGVQWVEILSRKREATNLADRLMVYGLRIRVYASIHNVEPDDEPIDLTSLSVQRRLAPDLSDYGDPDILATT